MAFSAIAAIAGLASAGAGIASSMNRPNTGQAQLNLQSQGLADARSNEAYQRALSALINQRSIAGTKDSFGSELHYDPATNQWVSSLGKLPFAAQTAADQAGIMRNTTDMRDANLANQESARRATLAGPAADAALRDATSFRPRTSADLVGLLTRQAAAASDATYRPLVSDTLRSFQRSGTAAGPVLASIGKQQADSLREGLLDAQIKGMTATDQVNAGQRQALEQSAANRNTLATPNFQYPGVTASDKSNTMASVIAQRAQQGGIAPAYGAGGVNNASTGLTTALKNMTVPAPQNNAADAVKGIGSMLQNKDFLNNVSSGYNWMFGSGSNGSTFTPDPNNTYGGQQVYYGPTNTGAPNESNF